VEFLRWSPSVRSGGGGRPSPQQLAEVQKVIAALQEAETDGANVNTAPGKASHGRGGATTPEGLDDMTAREIIALLPSLERGDLAALRDHEASHAGRTTVLRAIDGLLAREAHEPAGA
jgi:hypothetical protein